MAITVSNLQPDPLNVSGYTVQESATALAGGDLSQGVGSISVSADSFEDDVFLYSNDFTLRDTDKSASAGKTFMSGHVVNVTTDASNLSISAYSLLDKLNIFTEVPGFTASSGANKISDYLSTLFGVAGLGVTLSVDSAADYTMPPAPKYIGNLWELFKHLLTAYRLDLTVETTIVSEVPETTIRVKRRQDYADPSNAVPLDTLTDISESIGDSEIALTVEVNLYDYSVIGEADDKGYFYPLEQDPQVIQADAGETVIIDIPVQGAVDVVNQPEYVAIVQPPSYDYSGTNGVYTIVKNDNTPMTKSMWEAYGGFLKVELTSDPGTLRITLHGADYAPYAPYRLAMATDEDYFGSLRLTGRATLIKQDVISIPTAADPLRTEQEVGTTVSNPFITDVSMALNVGEWTARQYSGVTRSARMALDYDVAGFGDICGRLIEYKDSNLRINNVTHSPDSIAVQAEHFTTMGEFSDTWAGATLGDFATQWNGYTMREFGTRPLRRN